MPYTIDETLKSSDLNADLKPHMLWREVLLGERKKTVFAQAVEETADLIGAVGTKISVPKISSGFSASTITADNLDSSGYSASDLAFTDIDITIGDIVYVATKIADVLKEDQPKYNWVRIALQKAGQAIAEYRDAYIRDLLLAGAGTTITASSAGTLKYDDVADAVAKLEENSWFAEPMNPFLLFIHPAQKADLVKDTDFVDTERYSTAEVPLNAEIGRFASCRVLVTDNMTPALALVVAPPNHEYGPTTILAWKRRLTMKTDEEVSYGRTLYVLSERYGGAVVQANGIVLISNC